MSNRTPEYRTWERLQAFQNLHESWRNFHAFKSSVGARPGPNYQLRRQDKTKPHGPGNNIWIEVVKAPTKAQGTQVKQLAKALKQSERTIWRKLAKGLTPAQIQQGLSRQPYVPLTDDEQRARFDQKLAQLRADIQASKTRTADLQAELDKTLTLAQASELGDFSEPKPRPQPSTPEPPTPEPIKYTAYDLKLKEEKELARKKLMGADDPFKF